MLRINILRKHKRNQVTQVHTPATWTSSSIKIKWFAFLKKIKDAAELAEIGHQRTEKRNRCHNKVTDEKRKVLSAAKGVIWLQ